MAGRRPGARVAVGAALRLAATNVLLVLSLITAIGLAGAALSDRGAGQEGISGVFTAFWDSAPPFLYLGSIFALIGTAVAALLAPGLGRWFVRFETVGCSALAGAVLGTPLEGGTLPLAVFGGLVGLVVRLPRRDAEPAGAADSDPRG